MYDLLKDIRVLDVSLLAPSMLGSNLADLGAEVIKVEAPPHGDHSRSVGPPFKGGPSLTHLRWNRGKKSLALNLKTAVGAQVFLDLAAKSQVVVDGLRAGAMTRFGTDYEAVRGVNPRIVYCAISGLGHSGPYRDLGTHGVAFDSYAGIATARRREDGLPYIGPHVSVGTRLAPIYAAMGISAALVKAERTGESTFLDVAETDAAVYLQADDVLRILNGGGVRGPEPFKNGVRYQFYDTMDDKLIIFQAYEYKFWQNFCRSVRRPDLLERTASRPVEHQNTMDSADGDDALRHELAQIFRQRTQKEWVDFFIRENVPGAPVYSLGESLEDRHFLARENVITLEHPQVGMMRMPTTPIKVVGQQFGVLPAPGVGEQSADVLREVLGYDTARIDGLRTEGIVQ